MLQEMRNDERIELYTAPDCTPETRAFVESVEDHFEQSDQTIYKARNEIKVIGGYNVKRYGTPSLLNRLVYTYLRTPKAVRAVRNALRLQELGISTPSPYGYLLKYSSGLLSESYLVTEQIPLTRSMYEFGHVKHPEDKTDVLEAFGKFAAELHQKGILHLDFSPGNILFGNSREGGYQFALVDVNRMSFKSEPIPLAQGAQNMSRLWGDPPVQRAIAEAYTKARGEELERFYPLLQAAHDRFWSRRDTRWIHTPWRG